MQLYYKKKKLKVGKLPSTSPQGTFLPNIRGKQCMPVSNGLNVASNVKWDQYLQKKPVKLSMSEGYNIVENR